MVRLGDLIPDAARGARARGRAPPVAGDGHLRGARRRARAGRRGRVPGRPPRGVRARRRGRRPDRGAGAAPARDGAAERIRGRPGRASARANCASTSGAEVPAYNPGHLPAISRRPTAAEATPSPVDLVRPSPATLGPRGPPNTRGPDGRSTPDEARRRRRARPPPRLAGHARRRRAERRFRRALEGPALPARDLAHLVAPRPRGDAPRRRDDPQRVLLRRVGRDPGLPPEGDRDRQQAARPPGRPARAQDRRTATGRSASAWRSSAATRCTSRPSARPRPTSSARRASRRCPTRTASAACRRASSSRTSGAARSRSATRSSSSRPTSSPSSAPTSSRTRC